MNDDSFEPNLLEVWKVAAEHLQKGFDRRESIGSFYLSINVGVVSIVAAVAEALDSRRLWLLPLLAVGLLASVAWALQHHVVTESIAKRVKVVTRLEEQMRVEVFSVTAAKGVAAHAAGLFRRLLPGIFAITYVVAAVAIARGVGT